jgi:hypothetical protein
VPCYRYVTPQKIIHLEPNLFEAEGNKTERAGPLGYGPQATLPHGTGPWTSYLHHLILI